MTIARQTPHPRSPEWDLILACTRTRLDDANRGFIRKTLERPIDWSRLTLTAEQHHVASLLHHHLTGEFASGVPPQTLASLTDTMRVKARMSLVLAGNLIDLVNRFERAGIAAIPYKGPALASMAYGNFTMRSSEDLDFVLPQSQVLQAFEVLAAAGYRSELDPHMRRDARFIASGDAGQYCFFSDWPRSTVELHTEKTMRYFPAPISWAEVTGRLETVSLGGVDLRTFSFEDTLILLCVHGAKHFWGRVGWICDIAEMAQASRGQASGRQASRGIDWNLAEDVANRMGCRRMWLLGLSLAREVLDAPLPPEIVRKIAGDGGAADLNRQVQSSLFGANPSSRSLPKRLRFRLQCHDTVTNSVRQLARTATRPTERDVQAIPLPEWAWPLYGILRPLRLLRTHGLTADESTLHLGVFEPTPEEAVDRMLDLADLHPGDVLYDVGSGDGRIVLRAAQRFGIHAIGIEIDPARVANARANARRSGVKHLAEFWQRDVCATDLSPATVVTLYLEMSGVFAIAEKLRAQLRPGARVVSRDAIIPGWGNPDQTESVDIAPNRISKLYVWRIPAHSSGQTAGLVASTKP